MTQKKLIAMAAAAAMVAMIQTAQASLFNTGIDTAPVAGVDDNWKLLSTDGPGSPPAALVTVDAGAYPFNGPWINNDLVAGLTTSKWISYGPLDTTHVVGPNTFVYSLDFITSASDVGASMRWLSDNNSEAFLDGVSIGTRAPGTSTSTFHTWNAFIPIGNVGLVGSSHTITISVVNTGPASDNPTGVRAEFTAVPEPTTMIAGALLLLPFGASTLRILRKNRTA